MKTCRKCGEVKALGEFYKSKESQDGLYRHCKTCQNAMTKDWFKRNKQRVNELAREFHHRHRDKRITYMRDYYSKNRKRETMKAVDRYRKNRDEVIAHYGSVCKCCGEATREFLCIDHVNNDGHLHRRAINQCRIADWLIANKYPPGFQLLCANCNTGKKINSGTCPHELQYGLRIIEI